MDNVVEGRVVNLNQMWWFCPQPRLLRSSFAYYLKFSLYFLVFPFLKWAHSHLATFWMSLRCWPLLNLPWLFLDSLPPLYHSFHCSYYCNVIVQFQRSELPLQPSFLTYTHSPAFCALVHHYVPDSGIDFASLDPSKGRENCELAFTIAKERLNVPLLLDPEDVSVEPDVRTLPTYKAS